MNRRSENRQRGFTLLEILLALTILGIILSTVYGSLSRTLNSKEIAEERAELFARGRQAVLKIAEDVEGAMAPSFGDRIYFQGTERGGKPSMAFVAMNRGGFGLNRVRPGQVLIAYSIDPVPGRHDLFNLLREEYLFAALLAEADGIELPADEEEDDAPKAVASYLLDCYEHPDALNVPGSCVPLVGLQFRYLDSQTGEWRDEWDSNEEPTREMLPAAVEIALVLRDDRGLEHDFGTIVDLPLAAPTPGATPVTTQ